ncbi:hypothetical protein LXJ15735_28760 [Lacrimispora xylanolytica]
MFIGGCFSGSIGALSSSPVVPKEVEILSIENAIFDEIYSSNDLIETNDFDGTIPSRWEFETRLHALFQNNLYGGNVNFTESIVESVRIKRRLKNEAKFRTIFEKQIVNNDDFAIEIMDYFEPIGIIEYAYVPIISGGEGDYIINEVESKFDSYFICEKDISYPMVLDTAFNRKMIHRTSLVELQGRAKPIIIKGGKINYFTGDISCTFIELKNGLWQKSTSWKYRNTVYDFLTNGNTKILKDFLGNIYMVGVTSDEITEESDYYEHVTTKFSVAECGDAYSNGDLFDNGFIDTDLDR